MPVAASFAALVERAARLADSPGRSILGVVGSPGAGKSTLAAALVHELPRAAHVPMDGFHLADVSLERIGRLDSKGAPDTFDVGGYVALLRRLRTDSQDVVYAPGFERTLEQPIAAAIAVPRSARLIVTEGNYLLLDDGPWAAVRPELDEVWFCDADPELRLTRLVARHVEYGKTPEQARDWVSRVDEPNATLVDNTRRLADLVVPAEVLT